MVSWGKSAYQHYRNAMKTSEKEDNNMKHRSKLQAVIAMLLLVTMLTQQTSSVVAASSWGFYGGNQSLFTSTPAGADAIATRKGDVLDLFTSDSDGSVDAFTSGGINSFIISS